MKNKLKLFLIILGSILLLLSVSSIFIFNFNFGIVAIIAASSCILVYGLHFEKLVKIKLLSYSILSICFIAMIFMLFIYFYGKSDNTTFDEDVVIVLGSAVRGERVSLVLADRLDKAAEYHQSNPDVIIVVTGGQGVQASITEAEAMERYLVDKGIPKEKIIKEDKATSTYENLLFSKYILYELLGDEYKTVVITNDFHIYRAVQFAKMLGYDITHYSARTVWYSIPINYSRECMAIVKMWVLGW